MSSLVEFHCRTNASKDSLTKRIDLVVTARKRGIDRLIITDHNTTAGAMEAKKLDPELVIVGEEIITTKIIITIKNIILDAELFDSPCARAIAGALPIITEPNEWGDEFYFAIPVHMPSDDTATTSVSVGDIGYWPPGNAFSIFFGPTPMSKGSDPVPASAVNLVGRP